MLSEAGDVDKLKGSANGSISAGHFKFSEIPRTGGSMVGLLEDVIKVRQVMGFKMEGVIADLEELIGTQGGKKAIQETKMEKIEDFCVKQCWGNSVFDYVYSEAVGNSGGKWRLTGKNMMIIGVYAPQEGKEKQALWDFLRFEVDKWNGDVIIMGDFNEVRVKSDRFGTHFNPHGAHRFNSFILDSGLVEVNLGISRKMGDVCLFHFSIYAYLLALNALLVIERFDSVGAFSMLLDRIGFALKKDRNFFSTKVKYTDSDFDYVPGDRYANGTILDDRPPWKNVLASVEKGPLGIPTEIYALVSQHRVAKDLWEKIKLLMQGTSLTKQERECKCIIEFQDKFTFKKEILLHEYYLRFTLLLNDMNIYKMPLLAHYLCQLHLVTMHQHERHANEVCLMHARNSDPLALVASHQLTQPAYQSHLHTHPQSLSQLHVSPYQSSQFVTPYQTQQFTTNQSTPLSITYHQLTYQQQQPEFSQPDSSLVVPVFQKGDDPIDAINHMMSFLTAVVTSQYPTTNNQLRTSSNPRQQATIYDGKVTMQPVQGRQNTYGSGTKRKYIPGASGSNTGKQRTVLPVISNLSDSTSPQCCLSSDDLDASMNSDCDELNSAKDCSYGEFANQALTTELDRYKEEVKDLKEMQNVENSFSGSNEQYAEIVRLKQNLFEQVQEKDSLMKTVSDLKNDLKMEENKNIDREIALEKKIKQLDNIIFKEKAQESKPKLYDGNTILKMDTIVIPDSDETLMLCEESRSKLLLKEQDPMVVVKERTTATAITEGTWGFEHTKACFRDEIISFIKELKDIFNNFNQYLVEELVDVQMSFCQWNSSEQHRLESKFRKFKMNQVLSENERLLAQAIDNDIVKTVVNLSLNEGCETVNECQRCLELKTELLNKKDFVDKETYEKLCKSFTTLEKHCITLEADSQLNQEIFQLENSVLNQNAPSFTQLFELSELRAQSQAKDTVIVKLKEQIKSLNGNVDDRTVKMDMDEIETLNIELEHRVTKLVAENEHLKQTYKQLYDSIKPKRVQSKEQCDALIKQVNIKSGEIFDLNAKLQEQGLVIAALKNELRKLKGKAVDKEAIETHSVDPNVSKDNMEPITPKLLNKRTAHSSYIKHTQEEALVLRDIVEHVKANYPHDSLLESAFRSKTFSSARDHCLRLIPGNDRICKHQVLYSKNKVEAHPRNIKSSLNKRNGTVKVNGSASVQNSKKQDDSDYVCVNSNDCMSSDNLCVSNSLNVVKFRAKPKQHKSKKAIWKPTGKVFTQIGYIWRPTGRTFTIVGNACPLTRITTTNEVPSRKPIVLDSESPKPVVKLVYSRKPKKN
ncbi:retrovirus-related pol polyprotein from transposon TNT 1-94 [Tanacetum coccineum]